MINLVVEYYAPGYAEADTAFALSSTGLGYTFVTKDIHGLPS